MFNLEHAIAEWRRQMLAAGFKTPPPLEELESHLREEILRLVAAGKPEAEAFQLAVARLGNVRSIRAEFNKLVSAPIRPVKIGSWLWIAMSIAMAVLMFPAVLCGKWSLLLYIHVISVTAGYTAAFLVGGFGICHVCYKSFRVLSPCRQESLDRAVHRFAPLAAGLALVGMVLGMIWSKQNWGRYWNWNPKEIGALCVVIWLMALVATQHFTAMSERVRMLMCIGGNIVVGLAWFGVIAKGRGEHSYGMGHDWPLAAFLGIHVLFLLIGLVPVKQEQV